MHVSTASSVRYGLLNRLHYGQGSEFFRARSEGAHGFEKVVLLKRLSMRPSSDNFSTAGQAATRYLYPPPSPDRLRRRLAREAVVCSRLSFHNVVGVYDFYQQGDHVCLAMELVDGVGLDAILDLRRRLRQPIPPHALIALASQLLDALDYLHKARDSATEKKLEIVHRALSPDHILLDRCAVVKLVGFSYAQLAGEEPEKLELISRYTAPEARHRPRLTPAADLYSVAAVLYELFTLSPLVQEAQSAPLSATALDAALRRLPAEAMAIAPILRRALLPTPEERYRSAGEMVAALRAAKKGPPSDVPPGQVLRSLVEEVLFQSPAEPDKVEEEESELELDTSEGLLVDPSGWQPWSANGHNPFRLDTDLPDSDLDADEEALFGELELDEAAAGATRRRMHTVNLAGPEYTGDLPTFPGPMGDENATRNVTLTHFVSSPLLEFSAMNAPSHSPAAQTVTATAFAHELPPAEETRTASGPVAGSGELEKAAETVAAVVIPASLPEPNEVMTSDTTGVSRANGSPDRVLSPVDTPIADAATLDTEPAPCHNLDGSGPDPFALDRALLPQVPPQEDAEARVLGLKPLETVMADPAAPNPPSRQVRTDLRDAPTTPAPAHPSSTPTPPGTVAQRARAADPRVFYSLADDLPDDSITDPRAGERLRAQLRDIQLSPPTMATLERSPMSFLGSGETPPLPPTPAAVPHSLDAARGGMQTEALKPVAAPTTQPGLEGGMEGVDPSLFDSLKSRPEVQLYPSEPPAPPARMAEGAPPTVESLFRNPGALQSPSTPSPQPSPESGASTGARANRIGKIEPVEAVRADTSRAGGARADAASVRTTGKKPAREGNLGPAGRENSPTVIVRTDVILHKALAAAQTEEETSAVLRAIKNRGVQRLETPAQSPSVPLHSFDRPSPSMSDTFYRGAQNGGSHSASPQPQHTVGGAGPAVDSSPTRVLPAPHLRVDPRVDSSVETRLTQNPLLSVPVGRISAPVPEGENTFELNIDDLELDDLSQEQPIPTLQQLRQAAPAMGQSTLSQALGRPLTGGKGSSARGQTDRASVQVSVARGASAEDALLPPRALGGGQRPTSDPSVFANGSGANGSSANGSGVNGSGANGSGAHVRHAPTGHSGNHSVSSLTAQALASAQQVPFELVLIGMGGLTHLTVPPAGIWLGRSPRCDVVVADPRVASRHAQVSPFQGGFQLQCSQGEMVEAGGVRMRQVVLKPGIAVNVGPVSLMMLPAAVMPSFDYATLQRELVARFPTIAQQEVLRAEAGLRLHESSRQLPPDQLWSQLLDLYRENPDARPFRRLLEVLARVDTQAHEVARALETLRQLEKLS